MVIRRGEIHWVDLGEPRGSRPGKLRPVLVVQGDPHNESRLATTVVAALTSNVDLARVPGNVLVPAVLSGLAKDSVVNVSAVVTVDKSDLAGRAGAVPAHLMDQVDDGLRLVLAL
jgi:mRNA interferase MazF